MVITRKPNENIGSSPRAWGTLSSTSVDLSFLRFIPTCMGNSAEGSGYPAVLSVHPHVHGELSVSSTFSASSFGSSPRAWGTLPLLRTQQIYFRFIPTCMGNSTRARTPGVSRSVHPHVHGELQTELQAGDQDVGSSPRAWGTL